MTATKNSFKNMLQRDALTFQNLVKVKALIREHKAVTANYRGGDRSVWANASEFNLFIAKFNAQIDSFNKTVRSYVSRQQDYRKQPSIFEKTKDKVVRAFHSFYVKISSASGLGVAPLLLAVIPLVVKAGAIVGSIAVISAYVSKYFQATKVDYDDSLGQVVKLAEINPELASKALSSLNELQKSQNSSSAGKVLTIVGTVVVLGSGFAYGKHKNWW